jgi:arsenate reductase
MAEGLARASAPDGWDVYSAGSNPATLSSRAVAAMREIGLDIGDHYSKGLDDVPLTEADWVITLCADEECPVAFTRGRRLDWALPDPAAPAESDEAGRAAFRVARDAIAAKLDAFWQGEARGP